jgi:Protein of unknown function, DUF547
MTLHHLPAFALAACVIGACKAAPTDNNSTITKPAMALAQDSALAAKPGEQKGPLPATRHANERSTTTPASSTQEVALPIAQVVPATFDHALWNALLQAHVSAEGAVNYGAFAKDARLGEYLGKLSAAKDVNNWPRNERLAFWINAYNAFTIRLLLDHPTAKSIKDIDSPWKKKFFNLNGVLTNLDHVEHQELREKLGDERIHFAIVCASISCPSLWNRAFTAEGLEKQLDDAARRFINDPKRNVLGAKPQLSEIFNWFKGDFTKKGGLAEYINRYAATPIPVNASIRYLDYDWSLNGKR